MAEIIIQYPDNDEITLQPGESLQIGESTLFATEWGG